MGTNTSHRIYASVEANRMAIRVSGLLALIQIFGVDIGFFFDHLALQVWAAKKQRA